MAEEQVGTGYVLIKPKMDESAKSKLEDSGKKSGSGFGTAFQVAAGNIISSAVTTLASGVTEVFANAFNNYADYEQLVGGVETLFKESAETVQRNAEVAYRTAGISANEYMEQVTSFSASLLQGLGGDTEAAAAYADMAIKDMADNANKMGSDMSTITSAYQAFAKQNYTLLDNLKLGYGGTKTEMQRLLADASKIAGVEFNIDNYNDVIEAIHVMQEEMGIAGTTSLEATETISGSIGQLKASWQNFLTGLFDENADMYTLGESLFMSIGAVLKNVVPRIGVLVGKMIQGLPDAIINAILLIPDAIGPTIEKVFGEEMVGEMNAALAQATGRIVDVLEGAREKIKPVLEAIVAFVQQRVLPAVSAAAQYIMPYVERIAEFVCNVLNNIVDAVVAAIPIIDEAIQNACDFIDIAIRGLQPLIDFVAGVFDGIAYAIEHPLETAKNIVGGIVDAIRGFFNFSISWPHIPLPHPYISPTGWGVGDLLKGIIPSIGIEWYAKGGILDNPSLIGVGEAGAEAIIPLNNMRYVRPFAHALAGEIGVGSANYITVNLDYSAGEDAMTLARDLARELGNLLGMEG